MTHCKNFTALGAAIGIFLSLGVSGCAGETATAAPMPDEAATKEPSKMQDINAAKASEMISQNAALVVLDVRKPEEFAEGHIKGAMNVDFLSDDFADRLTSLDTSKAYVLHCKSGGRSAKALEVMKEQGFENIVHMNDGFDGWKAAGLPEQQ